MLGAAKTAYGSGKPLCRVFDLSADCFNCSLLVVQGKPNGFKTNLEHLVQTADGSSNTSSIQAYLAYVSGQQDECERHRMSRSVDVCERHP